LTVCDACGKEADYTVCIQHNLMDAPEHRRRETFDFCNACRRRVSIKIGDLGAITFQVDRGAVS
jgi:hypothetical protein